MQTVNLTSWYDSVQEARDHLTISLSEPRLLLVKCNAFGKWQYRYEYVLRSFIFQKRKIPVFCDPFPDSRFPDHLKKVTLVTADAQLTFRCSMVEIEDDDNNLVLRLRYVVCKGTQTIDQFKRCTIVVDDRIFCNYLVTMGISMAGHVRIEAEK